MKKRNREDNLLIILSEMMAELSAAFIIPASERMGTKFGNLEERKKVTQEIQTEIILNAKSDLFKKGYLKSEIIEALEGEDLSDLMVIVNNPIYDEHLDQKIYQLLELA